jgi:magnesium chelatase subunit D
MVAVKGAVLSLLLDAYQRRDKVGLITFRGDAADVALPPTGSVDMAAGLLSRLPTGGRTPIAAGLGRAARVLDAEQVRDPHRRPLLVLLTDGRATAPGEDPIAAARGLAARGVATLVVDTEDAAVRLGMARRLATALDAPCVRLEDLSAGHLAGLVRRLTAPRRAA